MTCREPDVDEFVCIECRAVVPRHPQDGMGECPQCIEEALRG